jgi:predicted transport protein
MNYTLDNLKDKIANMYPEIGTHHLGLSIAFDAQKNAYLVTFKRSAETLSTHLEKKDADDCMNNVKCVYLGVQVAQFIKNFDEREAFGRKAA